MPEEKKKNQKFGMPFFSKPARKVIQGIEFRSGKLKTYYTPGQNPDAGEPNLYTTPSSHWQPPNKILYRPQTVWLYVGVPLPYDTKYAQKQILTKVATNFPTYKFDDGFIGIASFSPHGYNGSFYADGSIKVIAGWLDPNPLNPTFPPVNSELGGWTLLTGPNVFPPSWIQSVAGPTSGNTAHPYLPNPYPLERARIREIYDNVKEVIEQLRPDRTYVQVIDPWVYDINTDTYPSPPPGPPRINNIYFGVKDIYFKNYDDGVSNLPLNGVPEPSWVAMVPIDQDDYFGVNFLYIYTGSPANVLFGQQGTGTGVVKDPLFIHAAAQKFCNYSLRMFGLDTFIEHEPPIETGGTPLIPPTKMIYPGSGTLLDPEWKVYAPGSFPPGGTLGDYGTVWTPISINPDIINNLIKGANLSRDRINIQNNAFLNNVANDLTAVNVDAKYLGEASLVNGSEDLIKLIANFYKFNFQTGKDL